ncbi:unnamed protein product, partial [marine sediment metagenome]
IRVNDWRMKKGLDPVDDTPFKAKDGKIYELKNQIVKVLKQRVD